MISEITRLMRKHLAEILITLKFKITFEIKSNILNESLEIRRNS